MHAKFEQNPHIQSKHTRGNQVLQTFLRKPSASVYKLYEKPECTSRVIEGDGEAHTRMRGSAGRENRVEKVGARETSDAAGEEGAPRGAREETRGAVRTPTPAGPLSPHYCACRVSHLPLLLLPTQTLTLLPRRLESSIPTHAIVYASASGFRCSWQHDTSYVCLLMEDIVYCRCVRERKRKREME